jgi:hypothetical protein
MMSRLAGLSMADLIAIKVDTIEELDQLNRKIKSGRYYAGPDNKPSYYRTDNDFKPIAQDELNGMCNWAQWLESIKNEVTDEYLNRRRDLFRPFEMTEEQKNIL